MKELNKCKPIEIKNIGSIVNEEPDDIFICTGSPEERCLGSIKKLENNYKINKLFILKYSHINETREKHINEMNRILNEIGVIKEEILIDEEAPIPMINEIIEKMKKYTKDIKNPKITIDISTFIKWHLLVFLNALDLTGIFNKCRFLYTEPKEYIIDLFQPLSFGIKEIFPVPLYCGNIDFAKDCLLVIFLGYEGDRAMALLENIDPTECLLLVPKPAYHPEWEGRTEEMNKEIINTVGESNIKYIDARNPIVTAKVLQEILSERKYSDYNILIAPLGTKPQALGLYLYWSNNSSKTTLIYNTPLRHNNLFYSEGIGRTWVLPVK